MDQAQAPASFNGPPPHTHTYTKENEMKQRTPSFWASNSQIVDQRWLPLPRSWIHLWSPAVQGSQGLTGSAQICYAADAAFSVVFVCTTSWFPVAPVRDVCQFTENFPWFTHVEQHTNTVPESTFPVPCRVRHFVWFCSNVFL